ncbi:MAG: hypothetical protein ACOYEV_04475 [Candidatus Nanopelagicales bacterium]
MPNPVVNPVGPEEPSVYWRRRAIAGVVAFVFAWLAWMVFGAATGRSDAAASAPSPTPTFGLSLSESPEPDDSATDGASDDATAETSPEASPGVSESPTDGESPSPDSASPTVTGVSGSPSPTTTGGTCDSASLSVVVAAAADSVASGSGTTLSMSVTNTGSVDCTRDLGAGANEIQVSGATGLAWSSDHCNPSMASDMQKLLSGQTWSTSVSWNGATSKVGCAAGAAPIAGSYTVVARNGDLLSAPVSITVQ